MGIFDSVAMGFATISPVVGLYAVVLVGMVVAGGAWVWVLPVALAGQCLLLAVYSELAAKYPLANGAYQWNRRLVGPRYGWFAGWVALCAYARGQHDDRLPRRAVGADAARDHADRARDRDHRRDPRAGLLARQRHRRRRAKGALRARRRGRGDRVGRASASRCCWSSASRARPRCSTPSAPRRCRGG